ncbi:MAG: DNA repair protein RecO [Acholeplasmataceae bacterium]
MEGIIIKVMDYKEYDRLLFMYTEEGRITLVAKGANKLNNETRALSQYLNLISFKEVNDKTMYNLMEAKLINSFSNLKNDYNLLNTASIMFDLLNLFIMDNDDHKNVYNLLKDALINFKIGNELSFGFKLLNIIGYGLNLKPEKKNPKGFNISLGRLIYEDEDYLIDLSLAHTLILLKLTFMSYDKIEEVVLKDYQVLKQFMYDYYEYHTDTKIKRK